jgi:xanthine dehydrogenase small subunit
MCEHYPELAELRQRFASLPIRNAGTLGGNVANGSPIGDSMPWLIALGAELVLRGAAGERVLALEDFYLGYQKKDLPPANSCRPARAAAARGRRLPHL